MAHEIYPGHHADAAWKDNPVMVYPTAQPLVSEGTAMDIAAQAQKEGVRDLRQSGLVKVRAGVTSLEEVITVTNE